MGEVSDLLRAMSAGDASAADRLLPLIYDEIRQLAAAHLAREKPGQTLQPTALAHEAYLRLVGGDAPAEWNGKAHFFAAVGVAIRRILIENARRKRSLKRGGDLARVPLDEAVVLDPSISPEELLALDEALTKLAAVKPQLAKLVELTYFAGLTMAEASEVLGVSTRTASRLWVYARAWLRREIDGDSLPGPDRG